MRVDEFDFTLPDELIALDPLEQREDARMLVVRDAALEDRRIGDLADLVTPNDLLVVNNTRVIPAALTAWRPARTGAVSADPVPIELNLLRCIDGAAWEAFARPARRLKAGDSLTFAGHALAATVTTPPTEGRIVLVFNRDGEAFQRALEAVGRAPLPPYIVSRRSIDARDTRNYQTVFAKVDGAVAAPTAGLHFSQAFLDRLRTTVAVEEITLHVGAGTFQPVKADDTRDHVMHHEWGQVPPDVARRITAHKQNGGTVLAVGTTSLRLLETAATDRGRLSGFEGETDLFITPGFEFRIVDALITNFHLPRSTLFMLVSAFAGLATMKTAYAHAIAERYRFYSYGDACLLDRRAAPPA